MSHASYLIHLASDSRQLRQQSIDAMAGELDRVEALALTGVVLHPGCYTTGTVHDGLDRVGAALVELFRARPPRDTMVLLEGTAGQGTSVGRTFEELAMIVARTDHHPRVGICLDTCHLRAAGYDLSTDVGYATTFERFDALSAWTVWACCTSTTRSDRSAAASTGMSTSARGSWRLETPKSARQTTAKHGRVTEDPLDTANLALLRSLVT